MRLLSKVYYDMYGLAEKDRKKAVQLGKMDEVGFGVGWKRLFFFCFFRKKKRRKKGAFFIDRQMMDGGKKGSDRLFRVHWGSLIKCILILFS